MRMLTPFTNWNSRNLSSDLFDEFDQMFEGFGRFPMAYDERNFTPAVELTENDDHYLVSVDLPGMKKDEIKIEMQNNILSISGERKREVNAGAKEKVQRYERSYGFFRRSFTLPNTVDSEKIEAQYENGVLQILLPKAATAKSRKIEIKQSKGGLMSKLLGSKEETKEMKDPNH